MARELPKKPRRVSDDEVRETILTMCREAGLDGVVRPEAVARVILQEHWQTILKRVRLMSKQLATAGLLTAIRRPRRIENSALFFIPNPSVGGLSTPI